MYFSLVPWLSMCEEGRPGTHSLLMRENIRYSHSLARAYALQQGIAVCSTHSTMFCIHILHIQRTEALLAEATDLISILKASVCECLLCHVAFILIIHHFRNYQDVLISSVNYSYLYFGDVSCVFMYILRLFT